MIIQICVGSSCHLKGSEALIALLQNAVQEHHLEHEVTLAGSFCTGDCNRIGVTLQVDDDVYPGITRETFNGFFNEKVLKKLQEERA